MTNIPAFWWAGAPFYLAFGVLVTIREAGADVIWVGIAFAVWSATALVYAWRLVAMRAAEKKPAAQRF